LSTAPSSFRSRIHISIFVFLVGAFHPNTIAAQTLAAQIAYPADGATNADMSQAIQWTTVLNAQAYELYLGSTLGAKDLLDSDQIQGTSYLATGVLGNQTVFARVWTEVAGVWQYSDSTFTTAATVATLTSPVNGATNVNVTLPIQWTTVAGAQAYELYLGSTLGAKDFVDSDQIQRTSYLAIGVPSNQTVFARLWTEVGGVWRSSDSTFTTAATVATLTSPVNGASNVNVMLPMQWTTIAGVQAYELYLGTTLGAKDLVDTDQLQQTWYLASSLAGGQTVFARLWTEAGGVWRFSDSSFKTAATVATLTSPINGATNVNTALPMQWTAVLNAQAYYLYGGTTLGTNNLVNTGEIHQTSYLAIGLPASQAVFARLWTKVGGIWRYSDSSFTTAATVATLTSPVNGATNVSMTLPMQWTTVVGTQAYELYLGSTLGAKNILDSDQTQQTSYLATGLPSSLTVFARLWTEVGGVWRFSDSTFTTEAGTVPVVAILTYPANSSTNVNRTLPMHWKSVPDAQAYELYLGSTLGAKDLIDTGEIQQTFYLGRGLPFGQTMFARLWTKVDDFWRYTDTTIGTVDGGR
jgi:hypothetical protein